MKTRLAMLLDMLQTNLIPRRQYNCWSAGITKKHRKVYERTYPTILVFEDGSTINIDYHVPRKIIKLPIDITTLSEAERIAILNKRRPKSKIVLQEEFEDDETFDSTRYVHYGKR